MKINLGTHTLDVPDNATVEIKGKQITVTGPRGEIGNPDVDGPPVLEDTAAGEIRNVDVDRPPALEDTAAGEIRNADVDRPPALENTTAEETGNPDVDRPAVLEDTTTTEIDSQWYQALFDEDCLKVMKLLEDHPRLLRVGWKEDPSRKVKGIVKGRLEDKPWMGRTALHVGASRGCAELIKQVLIMCGQNIEPVLSRLKGQGAEATAIPTTPTTTEDRFGKTTKQDVVDHWKSQVKDDTTKSAESAFGRWKRKLTVRKESSLHESGDISGSKKPQPPQLDSDSNPNTTNGDSLAGVDFGSLFFCVDGEYRLNAKEIAFLHGDTDVNALLQYVLTPDPVILSRIEKIRQFSRDNKAKRARLREATAKVIASFSDDPRCLRYLDAYSKHGEFNFLPREEYLFHFLFSWVPFIGMGPPFRFRMGVPLICDLFGKALWREVRSFQDIKLWRFLLELKDGQGRTPCHVAIRKWQMRGFIDVIQDGNDDEREVITCALTTCDGAGRTPIYVACATGNVSHMLECCKKGNYDEVLATYHSENYYPELLHPLKSLLPNSITPLQGAIIHRKVESVRFLLEGMTELRRTAKVLEETYYKCCWNYIFPLSIEMREPPLEWFGGKPVKRENVFVELDNLELAVLVGEEEIVELLFKAGYLPTSKQFSVRTELREEGKKEYIYVKHAWKALHFAAASGSYNLLKMVIDNAQCDPFIADFQGNTALHYAMKVDAFQLQYNKLLDRFTSVNCVHYKNSMRSSKVKEVLSEEDTIQRKGYINLLLQAGCDIFKANREKQTPYPIGKLSNNVEFLTWWYERQAKEFAAIQNSLTVAANAISVTATLVATASYVGPLQPPLGLNSTNQVQYENVWVAIFVFCDTLSFYLAIVAIIFSLVPSLPMPQQAMVQELRRTRAMVTVAVGVLFPSIISVLIAFASSSMAVISANITSSVGGKLTMSTLAICGPLLLVAFFVFFSRLLRNIFPRHAWIKYMYQLSDKSLLSIGNSYE